MQIVLAIIAVVVVGFIAAVAMQPDDFRIERSIVINAPPAKVFAVVNDYRRWNDWSPWSKLDPQAKFSYEGPATGVGAVYKWDGNNQVGAGISTITEVQPNALVRERLEFLRPFKATNTVDFTFVPEGAGTKMTWAMYGKNNFIGKAMGLVMNCEKMVGGQFDQGLSNLKAIVEK